MSDPILNTYSVVGNRSFQKTSLANRAIFLLAYLELRSIISHTI
jgi:hypothetical protein